MNLPPRCVHAHSYRSKRCVASSARHGLKGRQRAVPRKVLICNTPLIRGFTLVELTIVILIIAIVLAFSIPRLGHVTGYNLNVGSRRLSGTVKYLFHRATVTRTIYRLNYDLKANEYYVTYQDENLEFVSDPSALARRVKLPRDVSFEDIVILGRGKFDEEEVHTHFFPKGWVEETLIHLKDTRGRRASIHILPLSARVKIYDTYVEPSS